MKVILLKDISKVGQKYEVKEVANGYALNFLIPRGLVKVASDKGVKEIEKLKLKENQKRQKEISELKDKLAKIKGIALELKYPVNEKGHLFKGIHEKDLAEALKVQRGIAIEPKYISLEKPLKEVGEYQIAIKQFDPDIKIKISIKPAKSLA